MKSEPSGMSPPVAATEPTSFSDDAAPLQRDTWESLYRQHMSGALQVAYLLTGDRATAEDVAHDAFLAAASRLTGLRDPPRFDAYLRTTVVRTNLTRQRSAPRSLERERRSHLTLNDASSRYAADAVSVHRLDLLVALRALPARQQTAVVLRYWGDWPEQEIATALRWAAPLPED